METIIKTILAAAGGALVYLFGPCDALIITLVVVVSLDYVTGIIKGAILHQLSSSVGFHGLLKKVGIFALVALAAMLDRVVPSANGATRAAVCIFYIANEGLSILENVGQMGIPLPGILKTILVRLNKSTAEEPKDETTTD